MLKLNSTGVCLPRYRTANAAERMLSISGKRLSGKCLSGKVTFRETSVNPECLRGVFTTRRYTNSRLPLLTKRLGLITSRQSKYVLQTLTCDMGPCQINCLLMHLTLDHELQFTHLHSLKLKTLCNYPTVWLTWWILHLQSEKWNATALICGKLGLIKYS